MKKLNFIIIIMVSISLLGCFASKSSKIDKILDRSDALYEEASHVFDGINSAADSGYWDAADKAEKIMEEVTELQDKLFYYAEDMSKEKKDRADKIYDKFDKLMNSN